MFGWLGFGWGTDDTPAREWDDTQKDPPGRAILLGVMIPAVFIGLAVLSLVSGSAWLLEMRGAFELVRYDQPLAIGGAVLFKLGVAGIFTAWFGLANVTRLEDWCWPVASAAIICVAIGLVAFIVGALL